MTNFSEEQKKAVFHDKGDILVSASAGSGKTFVMISRAIRLIAENKTGVNGILAVTFTELAASEMKDKLKDALIEMINKGHPEKAKELADLDSADICTLHAFCARLIRLYFYVAGVSPDFNISDDNQSEILMQNAIDNVFRNNYEKGEDWFLNLINRHKHKRKDQDLKEFIKKLFEFCDVEAYPEKLYNKYKEICTADGFDKLISDYKFYLDRELKELITALNNAENIFADTTFTKSQKFICTLKQDLKTLLDGDLYSVKKYANYSLRADFERGLDGIFLQAKNSATEIRDEFLKLTERFSKHLEDREQDELKLFRVKEHSDNIAKLLKEYAEEYSKLKREENLLDFSDLEHYALKILSDSQVNEQVRQKYNYIFVDEYQDINAVQEEIISKIGNGNLFMVGDYKQSIYGFRGCRPEIFSEKERVISSCGGKAIRLNGNYRSAISVINAVNDIFSYSMTPEYYGTSYKDKAKLVFGGLFPNGYSGRAELHFLEDQNKGAREYEEARIYSIDKELNREAEETVTSTAMLISKIIKQEIGKTYYDLKEKKEKVITPNDIVILTRNRQGNYVSKLVGSLLKLHIPVNSEVSVSLLDFAEIQTLINLLRLIDNARVDLPLAGVLKSPIGGFDENDLLDIMIFYTDNVANAERRFSDAYYYSVHNNKSSLGDRLREFNAYIESVRTLADFTGAKGILEKVISDCGYYNYLLTERQGVNLVGRVEFFISLSKKGERLLTVGEFLKKIEKSPKSFESGSVSDKDSIRVMTIHASKGLEFPVVIVCGLERKSNNQDEREEILLDREYGFALKDYDDINKIKSETLLRGVLKERMYDNRMKEEMRLFYVATTRAQYSLHLTFNGKEDNRKDFFVGADKFLDYIPKNMPITEHIESDLMFESEKSQTRKIMIGKFNKDLSQEIKRNIEFVYPFAEDTALPLKVGVTSTLSQDEDAQDTDSVIYQINGEEQPEKTEYSKTGIERGIIAHKIMECMDFKNTAEFDKQIENIISSGVLSREQVGSINTERIKNALNNSVIRDIADKKLYRELPFMAEYPASMILKSQSQEKVVCQGVIDLLGVENNDAYIIDYKYSHLDGKKLKEKYQKQLDLYAYAVKNVLSYNIEKKALINLYSGEVIVLD